MAAATLVFGRSAMDVCKSKEVRKFVRLSMANDFNSALGPDDDALCPLIPKTVRQMYEEVTKRNAVLEDGEVCRKNKFTPHASQYKQRLFGEGGVAFYFLVSLFWASDVPCSFTTWSLKLTPDLLVDIPVLYKNKTLDLFGDKIKQGVMRLQRQGAHANSFHVVVLNSLPYEGLPLDRPQAIVDLLDGAAEDDATLCVRLEAVCITVFNSNKTHEAHSISAFPCVHRLSGKTKSKYTWYFCNSWGDNCEDVLSNFLVGLQRKYIYTHVATLALLYRHLGG